MANDVTLDVGANTKSAEKSLKGFAKEANKSIGGIESGIKTLQTAFIGFAGFLAGRQIIRGLEAITDAAGIQEKSVAQLNTALKLSGDFSQDASRSFQDFASSLQSTSTVGDEVILQQAALAKSFGLTNDQAKGLVAAAVDLSAATGITLESAVRNLGKTYSGLTGELGEILPQLRNFTAEQLKSGAAVEFATTRFGGAAEALTKNFSGATDQARNTFGDFLETLGMFITSNPLIIDGINSFSSALKDSSKFIQENKNQIISFVQGGLAGFADTLAPIIKGLLSFVNIVSVPVSLINQLSGAFRNLSIEFIQFILSFDLAKTVVNSVKDSFLSFFTSITKGISFLVEQTAKIPIIGKEFKEAGVDLESISKDIDDFAKSLESGIGEDVTKPLQDSLKRAQDANASFVDSVDSGIKGLRSGLTTAGGFVDGLGDKIRDLDLASKDAAEGLKNLEKAGTGIGGVFAGSIGSLNELFENTLKAISFENLDKRLTEIIKSVSPEQLIRAGISVAGNIGSSISSGAASFAEAISGGFVTLIRDSVNLIGNFPTEILKVFENLDEILGQFVSSLPDALASFFEKIPELTTAIVEALGKFVEIFIENAPKIADVLIDSFLKLFDKVLELLPSLIDKLPEIFQKFIDGFVSAFEILLKRLPAIITSIFNALPEIVRSIAAAIPELVTVFAENIGPIVIALVDGITAAIPQIVIALVDELIVKGGIFRIAFQLARAFAFELPKALGQSALNSTMQLFGGDLFKGFSASFGDLKPDFLNFGDAFSSKIKFPELNGDSFLGKLQNILTEPPFLKKLREILSNIGIDIPGGGGGILGGGGGILGGLTGGFGGGLGGGGGGGFGFADGGLVPAGFPQDNFIAGLSSGELVIPRGDVDKLSRFLDRQESGSSSPDIGQLLEGFNASSERSLTINLSVGEEQLSEVLLNLDRQGFRVA